MHSKAKLQASFISPEFDCHWVNGMHKFTAPPALYGLLKLSTNRSASLCIFAIQLAHIRNFATYNNPHSNRQHRFSKMEKNIPDQQGDSTATKDPQAIDCGTTKHCPTVDNRTPAEKRGYKIPKDVHTWEDFSQEQQKEYGDAKGRAAFCESYWGMARQMTIYENNFDALMQETTALTEGPDCLKRRVLLHEPHDATPEQEAVIREEQEKRVMQAEKEKAARGEGVDDGPLKWWEKFGGPVGMYEEED